MTVKREPYWQERLDRRPGQDRPCAGVMFDGTRATQRETRRVIWYGRRAATPYTRASIDGQNGVPFELDRYAVHGPAWDEIGLLDAWEAGRRVRNGARQDDALAWARRKIADWRKSRRRRR